MKKLFTILIVWFTLLGTANLKAQMSGSYTIGGSTPNFPNVTAAISNMEAVGVNGPVIFNIRNGNYNEQIAIAQISGASIINTITFRSETGDSSLVTIGYNSSATTNSIVHFLSGASYITFEKLTLKSLSSDSCRIIAIEGGTGGNISIRNCVLDGAISSGSSINQSLISVFDANFRMNDEFINNKFINGNWGIYYNGFDITNPFYPAPTVKGNIFNNQKLGALYIGYCHDVLIAENNINSNMPGFDAIRLEKSRAKVLRNKIIINNSGNGIFIDNDNTNPSNLHGFHVIANNMISCLGDGSNGIITDYAWNDSIVYNNIYTKNNVFNSNYAPVNISGGINNVMHNNIFFNDGQNYALKISAADFINCDYNNYYAIGTNLIYWNAPFTSLNQFQMAVNHDWFSMQKYPYFVSPNDLHVKNRFFDGVGMQLTNFLYDFDGNLRSPTPDIGADEFIVPAGLSGTYTIGSAADYPTISDAIKDAAFKGLLMDTYFSIKPGTYNEQLVIGEIWGTNPSVKLQIHSQNFDSSSVIINYNINQMGRNYIASLEGVDYIEFNRLTFQSTSIEYSGLIVLKNGADYNKFLHCRFLGSVANAVEGKKILVSSIGQHVMGNRFEGNLFANGETAILFKGEKFNRKDTINYFMLNTFYLQYFVGVDLWLQSSPEIAGNLFYNNGNNNHYMAIAVDSCFYDINIHDNKITNSQSGNGIVLSQAYGGQFNVGKIINNMITISGNNPTDTVYGLFLKNSTYIDITHNSIRTANENLASCPLKIIGNGNDLKIRNNIAVNTKLGKSIFIDNPVQISVMNNNNWKTAGNILGYWNGNIGTMQQWKQTTGFDNQSFNVWPKFKGPIDLHVLNDTTLNGKAVPTGIMYDFDGQHRRSTAPDIGADEFVVLNLRDTIIGCNRNVFLNANNPMAAINWSNGETTNQITVTASGTYWVNVIEPAGGPFASDTTVVVLSNVNATFNHTPGTGANEIDFSADFVANAKYAWAFGDYSFSNFQNPSHNYNHPGFYNVKLTVIDTLSKCQALTNESFEVGASPTACQASFTYVDNGSNNFSFNSSASIGNITHFHWLFGDGSFSRLPNPTKQYNHPGLFRVKLNVMDTAGNCMNVTEQLIAVGDTSSDCESDYIFYGDLNNTDITFIAMPVGTNIEYYNWNFGDGETSDAQVVTHTYTNPGFYNVCLSVTKQNGLCTDISCKNVAVGGGNASCYTEFSYVADSTNNKAAGYPVEFKGATSGDPSRVAWNFGDGNTDSLSVDIAHTYTAEGFYLVQMHSSFLNNCSSNFFGVVNVVSVNDTLVGLFGFNFSDDSNSKAAGYPVEFKGATSGDPSRVSWNFGDGTGDSSTLYPIHNYADTGYYNVCMTVENPQLSQSNTYCQQIHVQDFTVGIEDQPIYEKQINEISIAPNPFNNILNLKLNLVDESQVQVSLFNLIGTKLYETSINNYGVGAHQFNLKPNLEPGFYLLKININGEIKTYKILKV